MKININLANITSSEGTRDVKLKKIQTISFIALGIVAILSILLFLINLRFSANYVRNQQADLIKELSIHDETSSRLLILNSRLADIDSILASRRKYNETAGKIIEKIPASVVVEVFEISDGGIALEVASGSLLDLNEFLNNTLSLSSSKVIKNVILDGLSTEGSVYRMTIKAS